MNTAAISVVATAFVGTVGIIASALTARGQRLHAERLAHLAFIQARRGEAYTEVLAGVRRITRSILIESQLMQGPEAMQRPEAVPRGDSEVFLRLEAMIAVFGSEHVRDQLRDWSEKCGDFYATVYAATHRAAGASYPARAVEEARDAVMAAEGFLQAAARQDMEALEQTS